MDRTFNIGNSDCNCTLPEGMDCWPLVFRDGQWFRDNPVSYTVRIYGDNGIEKICDHETLDLAFSEAFNYASTRGIFGLSRDDFRLSSSGICGNGYITEMLNDSFYLEVIAQPLDCPIYD